MLFLDFLCIFFYIVLLNAHPISKSSSHNFTELEKTLDNDPIIRYSTGELLDHRYPTWKKQIFKEQDAEIPETNKLDLSEISKKHMKFKRITTKVMDLREFERLEDFGNKKHLQSSIKTYKVKEKETHTINNNKQHSDLYLTPISSFLEDKHVFNNDMSIEPTRDDTEFVGTAEIEAILNEIKQREIQMIADQIPSLSNLITNTVTETTFASMPLISESSIYPGFVFNTFLLMDNKSLINFESSPQNNHLRNSKIHVIGFRSVIDDSSILAHDVENMLQNKIKKYYYKIKKKITRDFDKEIKKSEATVKEQVDKINKKTCPTKVDSNNRTLPKATTKIPKMKTKPTLHEARNSRNTIFNQRKHKLTTFTTHTIPTVGDDLSMLSIVEQLLEKSEEDNAINMLTTKNNYSAKKEKERLFKRDLFLNRTFKKSNHKLSKKEDVLDSEYTHSYNSVYNDTKDNNLETDATTEDTSYEGLSNKLSYNDYVNGYKYYLNFQRDKEDHKYSNQVRYQAHKHHSVDDIGKFILNKIPQLPTSRLRRDFEDSEIYDVQDVTTKSEDSWFKKHFFIFMDSNTPKKFHSSQTVSLKPSGIESFSNLTTKQTFKNKHRKSHRFKKNIAKVKKILTKTSLDEPRYNVKTEPRRNQILRKLNKRSHLENHYKEKSNTLSNSNWRKNGFVDIDLIHKPTAIIKLNNKNKKTNKIRNIFHKLRFGQNKHKKKEKRQSHKRFNIFKGIRNIFKEKNEGEKELKDTKPHKIFDYEIMTTDTNAVQSNEVPKFKKLLKIEELRQQIPNITADFSVPHTFFSGSYINLTGDHGQRNEKFAYNKKPELDEERKSFSILTGSQYLKNNQHTVIYPHYTTNIQKDPKIDDIINVNIKSNTNYLAFPIKSNIAYPSLMGMTKSVIRNELDDMRMRLLNFPENKENHKILSTNLNKGYKDQYFHVYPKGKFSKEYQKGMVLINDVKQNNKLYFKNTATISDTTSRIFLSKKSPRKNTLLYLFNSNYSLAPIYSLKPLNNKNVQIDTERNSQDIDFKKAIPLVDPDPAMFAYRKSLNNSTMSKKKIDRTIFAYKKTSNSLTTPERKIVSNYNNNVDITIKKTLTQMNTPPEQYYSTPLPMQMDDFYKFLKDQNIDVESVTAPLLDSVPKRIETWNLYKKNISKLSSKHDKIKENNGHLKKNQNLKASVQSHKNHCNANLFAEENIQAKPSLEKPKSLNIDKNQFRKNSQETGETPEYENTNYLLRNQKYIRNSRENSNLMPHLYLGSMDLFQLDDSPKQPLVNSQKAANNMDVTVIDLNNKNSDSDGYKELFHTKMNKHEQSTKPNGLSNNISRWTFIEGNRDPLRFTHMYKEHILPKQSTSSPFSNNLNKNTTLLSTQRIQISGHSYKYDIIYQKPNNDWMSDLYEVNPKLFTKSIINYKSYPTTIKNEKGIDEWYYRGNTMFKNNDLITTPKKIKKNIYNLDHLSPDYTSTEIKNIKLLKKSFFGAEMKNKTFSNEEVKKIDEEVYFEPLIQHKSKLKKSQSKISNYNNKYNKRDVQGQDSFTAKDVAALEVVVDLMKSTESFDVKGLRKAFVDIDGQKNVSYVIPSLKYENQATNAIQVHIALPSIINDKKRSLEPIKIRKIFSALMSSPVDLEYQIHSFEDNKGVHTTRVPQNIISPGIYLLVENTNITVPKGNFELKPIRSHIGISNLILSNHSNSMLPYKSNMTDSLNYQVNLSKVTLNPDIVAAVNNQLVKLYENMVTLNETKSKRFINKKENDKIKQKIKRNINLESVKKYFGHDRVCTCHCKINETMCKPCAASDAVITELIFEFQNLAKYMTDHCTEIQTFFWMNPTGGRKFKDTVHRIDTILNNYYRRVKGKCQGRTCKMISSNIDKRENKINFSITQFLKNLESLANDLQKVVQQNICDVNIFNAGKKFVYRMNRCFNKNVNKRSDASYAGNLNNKSIYSLNNIRVNLICNKDLIKHANYFTRNTITEVLFERNTNFPLYYDEDEKKKKKKTKGIKEFLKKYSNKIKRKKVESPQIEVKNNKKFTKKIYKRHSISYNQIEAPFLADSGGTFWYKYLHENMREPRQQKFISNENNTKQTNIKKTTFLNKNTNKVKKCTDKNIIENTYTSNKNNLQQKANETDETLLNIDTLNHNLNDLFKLLGNTDTLQTNKTNLSKLTTLSKTEPSTKIPTSNKMISNLTTTVTTTRSSSKTNSKKNHFKSTFNSSHNTKKEKDSNAINKVSIKTVTPKILQTINTTISNSKVGLINRIVSGSLKFLGNNENKETTITKTESTNIKQRPAMKYLKKFRQKLRVNTEKYSFIENYNNEIDGNDKFTTLTEPTIIIIDDIDFSDKYTVSVNSIDSSKRDSIIYHLPRTVKRNSLKEKDCGELTEDNMNDIGLNSKLKFKSITQKATDLKNSEYFDYDIIHSIRKSLGLTLSNLTTPKERKGAINKLFDKFSIQIIPKDKKIEPKEIKANHSTISSKVSKINVVKNLNKIIPDTSTNFSTMKTTAAITAKKTQNKSSKTTDKTSHTQSNSGSHNNITKHLKEAVEDKLNQICDIDSTMAYVSKLQMNMLQQKFEKYVKNIPCHKYNKTPEHFIIRSCIRRPSKAYSKWFRKSKPFYEINRKRNHKWDWIRDKRSIFKHETSGDDKGKHFKALEKKYFSGCSVSSLLTNCVNVDEDNGNEEVNFYRNTKKIDKITDDYKIKRRNIKKKFTAQKKYNIHNTGFKKRNFVSFSNLTRKGYKKNSDLNFIQLWYGENDYYENFVRGKDGIYTKSLKRRKRLDVDMSELNEGLLNLPPLEPFNDEIYVMVAKSITFDCYTSALPKNKHKDYVWTTDRTGLLNFDNVMIKGAKVFINKIKTNNFGNYLCSVKNAIVRSIKITVIDLPNIDIVFTPLYEIDTCTYDDLNSLQKLNEPMSHFTCKHNCSVRIDEPICLKNCVDDSSLIRPIIVTSVKRQTNINCSAECLRDLQFSMALLFAKNAPALALVKVLISYNGTKRILSPLRERKRSFVTHTLRNKDTNGHREYHSLAADIDPNSVNVVLLCSAGFYLVVGQKICAVCPPDTFSLEGENVCRNCPRGVRSEPGSRSCRLSLHLQRYNCPWKYVYGGAVCMLSCVIASCYVVSRLLRQPVSTEEIKTCRKTRKVNIKKNTKSRPLSPSRVILSRLLRGSLSSAGATDSQETRFELWKEKNTLPPIPPIDFEL